MIWRKETDQSAKFQTFSCSREISPDLYIHRLLLLKVYKISAKKKIDELCLLTLKNDAKFEENLICFFKNDKNLVNFDLTTRFLKFSTLTSSFCAKYTTFHLNKYKGVLCHDTEEWCKIWRKTDVWLEK